MIFTTIIAAIIYLIPLLRLRQDASIFTSSLVVSYCLYLQWSGLSSDLEPKCNPFSELVLIPTHNAKANTISMMCFGIFFTFSALMVTGGKSKQAGEEEQASQIVAAIEDENEGKQPLMQVDEMNGEKTDAKDLHVFPITTGTIVFQALLTAAAIYYAMLLTNWGNPVFLNSSYDFFSD